MNAKMLILASSLMLTSAMKSEEPSRRAPILLELFTSEGCSSCPPADRLLQKLDREQPVNGADVIVLSEHVDYWNHDGWVDPFSSPVFSKRQRDYATLLGSEVYTPQLVIDGRNQVVGNDKSSVEHAIRDAEGRPKIPVNVTGKREADQIAVHVDIGPLEGSKTAGVYLVLASDQARSHVEHGENAGRDLEHVAVVRSVVKIATVSTGSGLQKDVRVALPRSVMTGNLRVAVFVQEEGPRRVLGVGEVRL